MTLDDAIIKHYPAGRSMDSMAHTRDMIRLVAAVNRETGNDYSFRRVWLICGKLKQAASIYAPDENYDDEDD